MLKGRLEYINISFNNCTSNTPSMIFFSLDTDITLMQSIKNSNSTISLFWKHITLNGHALINKTHALTVLCTILNYKMTGTTNANLSEKYPLKYLSCVYFYMQLWWICQVYFNLNWIITAKITLTAISVLSVMYEAFMLLKVTNLIDSESE